jgi:hypothetical protein
MRAGRFRGSRIRSPSWRNELNENVIRQKPGLAGLFILHVPRSANGGGKNSCASPWFYWLYAKRQAWAFCDSAWPTDENRCPAELSKLQLLRRGSV